MNYQERDKHHYLNKYFTKPSQSFQCPLQNRNFKEIYCLLFFLVNLTFIIALPIYFKIQATTKFNNLYDFRGDTCGIVYPGRPYFYRIQQIDASVCVSTCSSNTICVYEPNGINNYTDWCYPMNAKFKTPIYGACQQLNSSFTELLFSQFNKGYIILFGFIGILSCFILVWVGIIIGLIKCHKINVMAYLNIGATLALFILVCFIYSINDMLQVYWDVKALGFGLILVICIFDLLETFRMIFKSNGVYGNIFSEFMESSKSKFKILMITIVTFVINLTICIGQLYLISSYILTSKLTILSSINFPGGLLKQYKLSQYNLSLLILYIILSLSFINFMDYLKEFIIAYQYQSTFFNKKTQSILMNTLKEIGYCYKVSIVLFFSAILNSTFKKIKGIESIPLFKFLFSTLYVYLEEYYQLTFKYLHQWNINQRVFQGQNLSKGGEISYYLIKRNYASELPWHQNSLSQNNLNLFSFFPAMVCWLLIRFQSSDQTEVSYIRFGYVFFYIFYVQSRILSTTCFSTFDAIFKSILYCAAANKQMRYTKRNYFDQIINIIQTNKQKVPKKNKIDNIFNLQITESIEIRDNEKKEQVEPQQVISLKEQNIQKQKTEQNISDGVFKMKYKQTRGNKKIMRMKKQTKNDKNKNEDEDILKFNYSGREPKKPRKQNKLIFI